MEEYGLAAPVIHEIYIYDKSAVTGNISFFIFCIKQSSWPLLKALGEYKPYRIHAFKMWVYQSTILGLRTKDVVFRYSPCKKV